MLFHAGCQACLRAVANHMRMLCWLVKFAGPALLPLGASWDQLHQCWHTQAKMAKGGLTQGQMIKGDWLLNMVY